jgi:NAD(P)-dependent dehydrogenase (short-subunit alcohol dehydrogenase family)
MQEFEGKSILITGASSGIGRQLALQCPARGVAQVGLLARRESLLAQTAADLEQRSVQALVLPCDVTDPAQVETACKPFVSRWGAPDLLFLNAGIGEARSAPQLNVAHVRRIMEVNFFGAVHVLDVLLAPMVEKGGGRVVVTSSLAAIRGLPGFAAYSASKAALDRYIESLRVDLGPQLSFTTLEPGFVRTPLTRKNKFHMPFLLEPEDAAVRVWDAVAHRKLRLTFPSPMAWVMRVLKNTPDTLYDKLMRTASPRRPQKNHSH